MSIKKNHDFINTELRGQLLNYTPGDRDGEKIWKKQPDCAICLERYADSRDNKLILLRCNHLFHQACIMQHATFEVTPHEYNDRCPLCNRVMDITRKPSRYIDHGRVVVTIWTLLMMVLFAPFFTPKTHQPLERCIELPNGELQCKCLRKPPGTP